MGNECSVASNIKYDTNVTTSINNLIEPDSKASTCSSVHLFPFVQRCIDVLPVTSHLIQIGDFSSSTSEPIIRYLIQQIRKSHKSSQFHIHHIQAIDRSQDQPIIDHQAQPEQANLVINSLKVYSPSHRRQQESWLFNNDNSVSDESIFHSISKRNFYQKCVPDQTLSFIYSSSAFHWLSRVPAHLPRALVIRSRRNSIVERQEWQNQAQLDWKNLLFARSQELVKGGVLLMHNPATDNSSMNDQSIDIMDILYQVGLEVFTAMELERWTRPTYHRSYSEHIDTETLKQVGLELLFAEMLGEENQLYKKYTTNGNVEQFVRQYVGQLRTTHERSMVQILSDTEYHTREQKQIKIQFYFDQLYKRIHEQCTSDPTCPRQFAADKCRMIMALRKI